jgi:hypothetical protein
MSDLQLAHVNDGMVSVSKLVSSLVSTLATRLLFRIYSLEWHGLSATRELGLAGWQDPAQVYSTFVFRIGWI